MVRVSGTSAATMAMAPAAEPTEPFTDAQEDLLARRLDAFERYVMDALAALLHDDVIETTPPYAGQAQTPAASRASSVLWRPRSISSSARANSKVRALALGMSTSMSGGYPASL